MASLPEWTRRLRARRRLTTLRRRPQPPISSKPRLFVLRNESQLRQLGTAPMPGDARDAALLATESRAARAAPVIVRRRAASRCVELRRPALLSASRASAPKAIWMVREVPAPPRTAREPWSRRRPPPRCARPGSRRARSRRVHPCGRHLRACGLEIARRQRRLTELAAVVRRHDRAFTLLLGRQLAPEVERRAPVALLFVNPGQIFEHRGAIERR